MGQVVLNFAPDLSVLDVSYMVAIGVPASRIPGNSTTVNARAARVRSFPPINDTQWGSNIDGVTVSVFNARGELS